MILKLQTREGAIDGKHCQFFDDVKHVNRYEGLLYKPFDKDIYPTEARHPSLSQIAMESEDKDSDVKVVHFLNPTLYEANRGDWDNMDVDGFYYIAITFSYGGYRYLLRINTVVEVSLFNNNGVFIESLKKNNPPYPR